MLSPISNFRDIGGCSIVGGGSVRTGVLYRSASLADIGDHGVAHLDRLGIRTVIDLRRAEEVKRYGRIAEATGRRYVNVPPTHGLWESQRTTRRPDRLVTSPIATSTWLGTASTNMPRSCG